MHAVQYETVAAGQTAQVLGPNGGAGDWLEHVLIIPASTSPGVVTLLDGGTSIAIFAGGSSSLTELKPIDVPIKALSTTGAWKITTGSNVAAIAFGRFA